MKIFKSLFIVFLAITLMWNYSWLPKPDVSADADATNGYILNLDTDVASVPSGKSFTYEVKFSFSDLSLNGIDFSKLKLELPIPAGVEYQNTVSLPIIAGEIVTGNTATGTTVSYTFKTGPNAPIEGDSYTMQVNARYLPYVTLNGVSTITAARMIQDQTEVEKSNDVTVTATASAAWHLEKEKISPLPVPMAGGNVQYEIFFNNDQSASQIGVLDIENVKLTDALPIDSIFVSASNGGVYDPGTHTVKWEPSGTMRNDTRYYVTVNYPSPPFDDSSTVINNASVNFNALGDASPLSSADSVSHGFQSTPQDMGLGGGVFYKNVNQHQKEISAGQDVTFYVGGFHNRSNGDLTNANIVDMTPTEDTNLNPVNFNLKSINTATFQDIPSVSYSVYYSTIAAPSTWIHWEDVSTTVSDTLDVSDLPASTSVAGVKFEFPGPLPISFKQLSDFELTYTLASSHIAIPGQEIVNTADVNYSFDGMPKDYHDSASITLWGKRPLVELKKTRLGASTYSPEQEIEFEIRVTNTNLSSDKFHDPIVMDVLPSSLTYVPGSAVLHQSSGFDASSLTNTPIIGAAGSDTLMTWEFASAVELDPGDYFIIRYKAKVNKFAAPTTYINYGEVTTNSVSNPYFNDYWFDLKNDTGDHDGDLSTTDKLIRSEAQFTVNEVAALGSFKRVRGELDSDWKLGDMSSLGSTVAGGRVDYKLTVYNKGNVPLDHIVLVDVLPRQGDEGALLGARGTTWNTVLTEALPANPDYTVEYSIDVHPKMTGSTWTTTAPDDLTTVTALRFVFTPSLQLAPDAKKEIVWTMQAPLGTPTTQIAWNSFGQQASKLNGSALAPAEPPKVGVNILPNVNQSIGDYVWVDLDKDGIQDEDLAEWGVNGVRVDLLKADGTPFTKSYNDDGNLVSTPIFTITSDDATGNPGYYLFPNLPSGTYKVKFTLPTNLPADYVYNYGTNTANPFDTWTIKGIGGATDSNVGGTLVTPETSAFLITDNIVLGATDDLTIDAGLYPPLGAIGDTVWKDVNGNGINDAGDTTISGVKVDLLNASNVEISTTMTDASGLYLFNNLMPGQYKVRFPQMSGTLILTHKNTGSNKLIDSNPSANGISDNINLQLGEVNLTIDAGYVEPVQLGDTVWEDGNGDGLQGGGTDTPRSGVVVRLLNASNAPIKETDGITNRTKTTDAFGNYLFENLLPGTYRVEFVLPTGYGFTWKNQNNNGNDSTDSDVDRIANNAPTLQTSGRTDTITTVTAPGSSDITVDAGIVKLVSLGDYVWMDKDNDGIQEAGESGVPGVTVKLYFDDVSTTVAHRTTTTASDGKYQFDNLYPGKYTVEFTRPDGYLFTVKGDGTQPTVDSKAIVPAPNTPTAKASQISLLNVNNMDQDAGLVELVSVGDFIWLDANYDGLQTLGETGISGVQVKLLDSAELEVTSDAYGLPISELTTIANGAYLFKNLIPGSYKVQFTLPNGYWFTALNTGSNEALDSDAVMDITDSMVGIANVTLAIGDHDMRVDAGVNTLPSLGDYVWIDTGVIGLQEAGETGYNGVTVTLLNELGVSLATTTTANDGSGNPGYYSFNDLIPGKYSVSFNLPTGYLFTRKQVSSAVPATDSNVSPTGQSDTVTLVVGDDDHTIDAGIVLPASLGNYVWTDDNMNGIQEPAEKGTNGITIELFDDKGTLLSTTTTANDGGGNPGYYTFTNLVPGTYQVKFTAPVGNMFTMKQSGTDNTLDSDAGLEGTTDLITLQPGENNVTIDAGIHSIPITLPATLGNYVWIDTNKNGIQETAENGINGIVVELYNVFDAKISSTITANNELGRAGYYAFKNLLPNNYSIKFIVPEDYTLSPQSTGSNRDTDSDADTNGKTAAVNLQPGANNLSLDAGLIPKASIGNYVWIDKNRNGIQDSSEIGQNGIEVTLYDESGAVVATTITDYSSNGKPGIYLFPDLDPGKYSIKFDLPVGYAFTKKQGSGSSTETDSNAAADGYTEQFELPSGMNDLSWDAGIYLEIETEPVIEQEEEGSGTTKPTPTEPVKDNSGKGNTPAKPTKPRGDGKSGVGKGDSSEGSSSNGSQTGANGKGNLPQTGEQMPVLPIYGYVLSLAAIVLLSARWIIKRKQMKA